MNRKILSCMLIIIMLILMTTIVKATNVIKVEDLNDLKDLIEENSKGNVDIYDVLQAYKDLSENYSNDEIATAIEENKQLLESQGISEEVIDSGTSLLRSVDAKQLNKILSEDIDIDEIQQQLEDGATPTEILDNIQQDMTTTDKISLGLNLIMAFTAFKIIFWTIVVLIIYNIIVRWRIYKKAGKHAWAAIIPIYRDIVMYKICDVSPWVLLLALIPIIGWFILIIINIYTKFTLAEGFGKGIGFGFGLWLLGPIFEAILAFSRKTMYIGFGK